MPISTRKIQLLHVAKRKLGLDDEAWRELLDQAAGVETSKALDEAGFKAVMSRLEALGFQSLRAARSLGDRPGMATDDQLEYIRDLWRRYSGRRDEKSLNAWLEHSFGVTAPRFLDAETAAKAIPALKAMTRRSSRT